MSFSQIGLLLDKKKMRRILIHHEDKLCILQIRHSAKGKNRIIAESTTMLFFFDLPCCFGFHGQIAKTLYSSTSLRKSNFAESATNLPSPEQFVEFANKQYKMCLVNLSCRGIRICKRNPQIVSGIHNL